MGRWVARSKDGVAVLNVFDCGVSYYAPNMNNLVAINMMQPYGSQA